MIRVIDDGTGMAHDDALLAFERHATSKLRTADDLLSIATLGFRGEALPSIAAVSRLLLQTRAAEEEEGTRIEFAGGKLVGVKPEGLPAGTTISVADLFYCVPARRNFLKSETTELGHIASLVTHYALAHPDKQFVLKTPTQEIINATAVETMAERVYQLFGRQALEELFEILPVSSPMRAAITETELDPEERAAELVVRGFASRPEVQRSNRNGIYVFVNRRLVRDRLILHAIHEAYRNVLPPAVFPAVLLFLDLPAEEVDVNVHPAKIEVRFRHPQFVHDFTRDSIRQALSRARPIPSFPGVPSSARGAGKSASRAAPPQLPLRARVTQRGGLPRAVIPPMNTAGCSGRRDRRRFRIERRAAAAGAATLPVRKRHRNAVRRIGLRDRGAIWRGRSPRPLRDAAASVDAGIAGERRKPGRTQAAGAGEFELHRRGERRRAVDHRPARGARARAVRAAPARAARRAAHRPAHAGAADGGAFAAATRHFRTRSPRS